MRDSTLLDKLLATRDFILTDGATGTGLFELGLTAGEAPETWNIKHEKKIREHYQSFIDSDCDIILTNSFGGNSLRLKLHGLSDKAFLFSKISAEIGRDLINKSNKEVILAGSVGPTGELIKPLGTLNYEDAVEVFHEQMEGLKAGGIDLVWAETLSDPVEYQAISEAAGLTKIQWCGTMSFDTKGNTMMGFTPSNLVDLIEQLVFKPIAAGANCGVGPSDLIRTILDFEAAKFPVIAKSNAGIPEFVNGKIQYSGTPALMAEYAFLARSAGARIIGGCCGTSAKHIKAMREVLVSRESSRRPSLKEIESKLGPFSGVPGFRMRKKRNARARTKFKV